MPQLSLMGRVMDLLQRIQLICEELVVLLLVLKRI